MKKSKLVVIEKDMHCPYCNTDSAVIISETISRKSRIGCAAIGCKDGCLMYITGFLWAIVIGIPLFDKNEEYDTVNYGFCPHCGNTYPIIKPDKSTLKLNETTVGERLENNIDRAKNQINSVKGLLNRDNK